MAARGRRVALLTGGHASEHEIALRSARTLAGWMVEAGFEPQVVVIGTDGTWSLAPAGQDVELPEVLAGPLPGAVCSGSPLAVTRALLEGGVDRAVIALHGPLGEDGAIQGFLDVAGIAYGTCGVTASAVCMDKVLFKKLLEADGLPTPGFVEILREEAAGGQSLPDADRRAVERLGLPVVVKPRALGSSVGVVIVRDGAEFGAALASAFREDVAALVEAYVPGRELTVAVVGPSDVPETFPVVEIVPRKADWFDRSSKYDPGGADEIVPARIPAAVEARARRLAVQVHGLVGAKGTTRTDLILDGDGELWILETNTLPGMTGASLFPKAIAAAGWSGADLVRRLVPEARRR